MQPAQQAVPDITFAFETPQIGDQVIVSLTISDDKGMLTSRLLLPPDMAKQLAHALISVADKAQQTLVKPKSLIATA